MKTPKEAREAEREGERARKCYVNTRAGGVKKSHNLSRISPCRLCGWKKKKKKKREKQAENVGYENRKMILQL